MRLFGKKESKKSCCGSCTSEVMNEAETLREKRVLIFWGLVVRSVRH